MTYDIDLQIQELKKGPNDNQQQIGTLEAAKLQFQREFVAKQVELEWRKAQAQKARQH